MSFDYWRMIELHSLLREISLLEKNCVLITVRISGMVVRI
jgi:hypothetical protein